MSTSKARRQRKQARQVTRVLENVPDYSIIAIKGGYFSQYQLNEISKMLAQTDRKNCLLIGVHKLDDIELLDEEAMMSHGWQKVPMENNGGQDGAES